MATKVLRQLMVSSSDPTDAAPPEPELRQVSPGVGPPTLLLCSAPVVPSNAAPDNVAVREEAAVDLWHTRQLVCAQASDWRAPCRAS